MIPLLLIIAFIAFCAGSGDFAVGMLLLALVIYIMSDNRRRPRF
jgi:hypothetical protein